ncbi:MAG: response regulator [Campylobacterales bacterium]|nr:response regulator [Campylobacterales bacterium]
MNTPKKLPISILIVDDEPSIVEQLSQILARRVETLYTAGNGAEALACYRSYPLDLIISDIDMPVMGGIELLKSVREQDSRLPFILSTGLKSLDVLIQGIEYGISSFLPKPLQKKSLIAKIEEVARTKELTLALKKKSFLLEQYKSIVDSSSIVSKTDREGIITFVNDMFCEISGYSREELVGRPHSIVRDPKMPSAVFKEMWRTISAKQIWRGLINNRTKEGDLYTVKTTIAPILDEEGNISEYIGLREDITELNRAKNEAKAAAKMKGDFLANMSHEIRTPMNGIIGFTELLSKSGLNEKQQRYMEVINSSTHALMGIVNNILNFSKIESGKSELELKPNNPFVELEAMAQLFTVAAQKKQIHFSTVFDPEIPHCLVFDTLRLGQVVANLLNNALKFTPEEGEVLFYARCLSRSEEATQIRIGIKDKGIGIPRSKQAKIFEAFSQADNSITRNFGGTGLGLSISSQLVALMGGELKVKSEEGKGSEFYFEPSFKICDEQAQDSDAKSPDGPVRFVGRVLVAEDNRVNQMVIDEYLRQFSLDTVIVENGLEALNRLEHEAFDLIFMDVNMPVMGGVEAMRQIKAKKLTSPVVALTANAMEGDRESFIAKGFDAYLAKPLVREELIALLSLYLLAAETQPLIPEETAVPVQKSASTILNMQAIRQELSLPSTVINKLLALFLKTSPPYIEELEAAIAKSDYTEIENTAHKIKGAAGSLRLKSIEDLSSRIEAAARQAQPCDYAALGKELEKMLIQAQQEISEFLATA